MIRVVFYLNFFFHFLQESGPLTRPYTCFPSSIIPSISPTSLPSTKPSLDITALPSQEPSLRDSNPPSQLPTIHPSRIPSEEPTKSSTSPTVHREPSATPSFSSEPSNFPSDFSMSMSYDLSMSMAFDANIDTRESTYLLEGYAAEFGKVKRKKEKKLQK